MPTISVVVPAYNAESTILKTITSVQQQTFADFELIIINDGSTDGTLDLLNTLEDSRLKIFTYENGGLSVARNRGISRARGEFIAFLDADDLWTSDKLELQLAALQQHPEAGVAYSWTHFMDEQGESFHADKPLFFEGNVYPQLLVHNFLASGSNPLIRRQAIESVGEFNPSVSGAADWDYWLRLAARWPFAVVPKPQIFYRQSSSSMSSRVDFMEGCQIQVIEQAFLSVPPELQALKKHSLAYIYQYSVQLYLTRIPGMEGAKQAAQKLIQAIWLYPQILFDKKTQKLAFKLLLMYVLSPKIANYILQKFSRVRATRILADNDSKGFPA